MDSQEQKPEVKEEQKTQEQPVSPEAAKELKEAEARSGVKEAAMNSEAIAAQKDKEPTAAKPAVPSFFVQEADRQRVTVDILSNKDSGQILSVIGAGHDVDWTLFQNLLHTTQWFEFSIPNYAEMTGYRQRASVYRKEFQQVLVDKLQMRNFLIAWHLKDWSLTGRDGKKVELQFDPEGSLANDSMRVVFSVQSVILDVVLTILEKDILLNV